MAANLPRGHGSPMRPAGIRARHGPRRPRTAAVSRLCLGTMLMGGRTPPDEAQRMLDAYVAAGPTSSTPPTSTATAPPSRRWRRGWRAGATRSWSRPRSASRSPIRAAAGLAPERIVRGVRRVAAAAGDRRHRPLPGPRARPRRRARGHAGGARRPRARRQGARAGASNFPAWLLAWAVAVQDREGLSPFVSLQPQYSLVERSIETEILPFCRAAGLGVLPWGPLGAGFLRPLRARGGAAGGLAHRRRRGRPRGGASTGAGPSPTSAPSTRRGRGRRARARASRRSRSRGCSPSRASPRPSSARARPSSSRTCSPPRSWR